MASRSSLPPPPRTVRVAVALMYVGALITGLAIVIALSGWDEADGRLQLDVDGGSGGSAIGPDAVLRVGVPVGVVAASVVVALWVWMAVANRRGETWARVWATALGALGVAFHAAGSAEDGLEPVDLVRLVLLVHAVTIVVLLWRPVSSQYYSEVTRERARYR